MNKAHSVSNRQPKVEFESLNHKLSNEVSEVLRKTASGIDYSIAKQAMLGNGFHLFSTVRKMIANKLGVSEMIAEDMTSKVITKSEKVMKEYGGSQEDIIHHIIEEMGRQSVGMPGGVSNNGFDLHPITYQTKEIQEVIKLRLIQEMGMNNSEAEMFQNIIFQNAQDLTVSLRPRKRDEIARALVDLIVDMKDKTVIYNIKSSPTLLEALKAFLD